LAKALIVSGDTNVRYLYETAIRFQKMEATTVKTIKEAISTIISKLPDLVIIDLETIDLAEISLFKEITKRKKRLPIIIMTDLSVEEAKKQACVMGACEVLAKKQATLGNLIKTARQRVKK
jgi:DNA-binding NtrC family response regulator